MNGKKQTCSEEKYIELHAAAQQWTPLLQQRARLRLCVAGKLRHRPRSECRQSCGSGLIWRRSGCQRVHLLR